MLYYAENLIEFKRSPNFVFPSDLHKFINSQSNPDDWQIYTKRVGKRS
jgi:hypothetical protein